MLTRPRSPAMLEEELITYSSHRVAFATRTRPPFVCSICGEELDVSLIAEHMTNCHGGEPTSFRCGCGVTHGALSEFIGHSCHRTQGPQVRYECDFCQGLKHITEITAHLWYNHGVMTESFACGCGETRRMTRGMENHECESAFLTVWYRATPRPSPVLTGQGQPFMRMERQGDSFTCVCGEVLGFGEITGHVRLAHKRTLHAVQCSKCELMFQSPSDFVNHPCADTSMIIWKA